MSITGSLANEKHLCEVHKVPSVEQLMPLITKNTLHKQSKAIIRTHTLCNTTCTTLQWRQTGLKFEIWGSMIRVKKFDFPGKFPKTFDFFPGKFSKNFDLSRQIFEKFLFFQAKIFEYSSYLLKNFRLSRQICHLQLYFA